MSSPAVMEDDKFSRITVPIFSTKWAIVLCVCNFLVPGLGTCLAGLTLCCPCSDNPSFGCADCCCSAWLQFGVAALQLLLAPVCLLGWVWSCIWGCAFIGRSNPEWRARQQASQRRQHDAMLSLVTEQPTSGPSDFAGFAAFGRGGEGWRHHLGRLRQQRPFDYGPLPPAYAEPPPPPYEAAVAAASDEAAAGQRGRELATSAPQQQQEQSR